MIIKVEAINIADMLMAANFTQFIVQVINDESLG